MKQKIAISEEVLFAKHKHKDIAKKYRVALGTISVIMCKLRKKPKMFEVLQ